MKYNHALSSALIGASIVLVQSQVANALSTEQVGEIAQGITVLIESTDKKDNGSGIIIQKSGNTYTVLTAAHVVAKAQKYKIVTPDNQPYPLDYSKVKKLPNQIDLAVVTFTSNTNYQVAKVGNPDKAKLGTAVYVAGFPKQTASRTFSSINFPPPGQITANATQAVDGGYTLVYSVPTLPGMSGGPLLNQQGELIGVHGRGETATIDDVTYDEINPQVAIIKSNNNLAISIYTFLRQAKAVNVDLGISAPPLQVAQALTAEDYFLKGVEKGNKKDYQGAIKDFNQAIKINPKLAPAYYNRGTAYGILKDYQEAIQDFTQAIKINPKYANYYVNRGTAHIFLKDYQGAIEDYNKAIKINPNDAETYHNRGVARFFIKDYKGAIEDYNKAIKINPKHAKYYVNMGFSRIKIKDYQGAINHFKQALKINPKHANAYIGMGSSRVFLKDYQGAINDLNIAANLFKERNDIGNYKKALGLIKITQKLQNESLQR